LVGVRSIQDLGDRRGEAVRTGKTARELMTSDVPTATPGMTLDEVLELMRKEPIGSRPVVEREKVVGIATATGVLDALRQGCARAIRWHCGRKPESMKRAVRGADPVGAEA